MSNRKTMLERAFEISSTGTVADMTELERALQKEGFSTAGIVGPILRRQLRDRIQLARDGLQSVGIQN